MKSDVKAVRKTDATSVFAGRTRLRGIILASTGSAGSVTLQDGNSVTQFQVDVPAGDVFAYNLAEDGILFEGGMTVSAISNAVAESMEINIQRVNAKLEGSVTFNFVSSTFGLLLGLPQGHQQTEYGTDLHWLDWLLTKGDAVVVQGFMYEPSNGGRSGGGSMKLGGYFKVPSQFSGVPTDNFITRAFQGKEKQISAVLNKYLV